MKWITGWAIISSMQVYFLVQAILINFIFNSFAGYVPWLFLMGFYFGYIFFYKEKE